MQDTLFAYAGMFWSAFLAATVLPGASEVMFVALLVSGGVDPWTLLAFATVGNTLGSVVNWAMGRFLLRYRDRRWFPVSSTSIERWSGTFRRYGLWSLLFAWAPVAGDTLTVIAGILRVRIVPFISIVGTGKLARYLVLMFGTLFWV